MSIEDDSEIAQIENPHRLWKQLLGVAIWTGPLALFAGGVTGAVLAYILGGLTFADAWLAGIYKRQDQKSFLNISPMGWGIVVPMLFIVGFPVYALNRNKLKTRPGQTTLFGLVLGIGSLVLLSWAISIYQVVAGGSGV